jgi:hypothetical protein
MSTDSPSSRVDFLDNPIPDLVFTKTTSLLDFVKLCESRTSVTIRVDRKVHFNSFIFLSLSHVPLSLSALPHSRLICVAKSSR